MQLENSPEKVVQYNMMYAEQHSSFSPSLAQQLCTFDSKNTTPLKNVSIRAILLVVWVFKFFWQLNDDIILIIKIQYTDQIIKINPEIKIPCCIAHIS